MISGGITEIEQGERGRAHEAVLFQLVRTLLDDLAEMTSLGVQGAFLLHRSRGISFITRRASSAAAVSGLRDVLRAELDGIREAGTWKAERVITTPQAAAIRVQGRAGTVLNFCANNYLGLSAHPEMIEAGRAALTKYGAGLSSVRFICGTQDIHKELEGKISEFHGQEDTVLYASCFDANAGLFEALLTEDDALLSDQLNHASIIDGVRLAKTNKHRYSHRNMSELEQLLKENRGRRMKLIVSDGVFSMDGNLAPLRDICRLASEYGALVFLDECHATGILGATGRGTEEHAGLTGNVAIINSTLGKALGGAAGGYTTGPRELIDLLRQRSRPYLFSNSLPPAVVAMASKVFDLLMDGSQLVDRLHASTRYFRSAIKEAGFTLKGDNHPIVPVMLGDARLAGEFADEMLERGIYVIGFSYPVVPKGEARIRVQISATHSQANLDQCITAFIEIGKRRGVIP